jgi:adenine-specific DNA-methyltransferase
MNQVVIENPIINSPFDEPTRHFQFSGEGFFVRHAYFTGADEPYDKLKRALRADIDEAAWNSLYSTVSRPFDEPESRRIAVKVINHYGDEVLKVFEV